jgi:hypothetical protein
MANVCFTCGEYHLKSGNGTAAARMALKALCIYPKVLYDPKMFHKFLYCLFSEHWVYRSSLSIYYRLRAARSRFEKQNLINGVGSSFDSHSPSAFEAQNLSAEIQHTAQGDH